MFSAIPKQPSHQITGLTKFGQTQQTQPSTMFASPFQSVAGGIGISFPSNSTFSQASTVRGSSLTITRSNTLLGTSTEASRSSTPSPFVQANLSHETSDHTIKAFLSAIQDLQAIEFSAKSVASLPQKLDALHKAATNINLQQGDAIAVNGPYLTAAQIHLWVKPDHQIQSPQPLMRLPEGSDIQMVPVSSLVIENPEEGPLALTLPKKPTWSTHPSKRDQSPEQHSRLMSLGPHTPSSSTPDIQLDENNTHMIVGHASLTVTKSDEEMMEMLKLNRPTK